MTYATFDWNSKWLTLSKDGPQCRAVALLAGVSVEGQSISYGPLTLRSLDEATDSKLLQNHPVDYIQRSVLELQYVDYSKDTRSMYIEPMEVIVRAFRTLQLLIDNWVGSSVAYHFDITNEEELGYTGSRNFELADSTSYQAAANLTIDQTPSRELFVRIFDVQSGPFDTMISPHIDALGHALDRFSRACTEIRSESILDFVISLEGTLGFGLDSEFSHRLAARGALLLAENPQQRANYYKILKYLYNVRSKMVHQGGYNFNTGLPEASILALGYNLDEWDQDYPHKAHFIADIARKISRATLLKFVNDKNLLSANRLKEIELGITP